MNRTAKHWMIAATMAAALGTTGLAQAEGNPGKRGHHGQHAQMDPEKRAAHIQKMIARVAPEATDDQKSRLRAIATSAFSDLAPMLAERRAASKQLHNLMKQTTIDRAALERLRQEQVKRHDTSSKRMLAAMVDAAEVLTPAQRERFARMMARRFQH